MDDLYVFSLDDGVVSFSIQPDHATYVRGLEAEVRGLRSTLEAWRSAARNAIEDHAFWGPERPSLSDSVG
ncbi:MAG: hypothetical protein E6K18_07325 [Methanobacteriota archaeon]|nr:MAG: hypothetical protein E6K18_07325 [Euryarchaeota archaeon]